MRKVVLFLIILIVSTINIFSSEWDNLIRTTFTYGGILNSNQFQQFGTKLISDGISSARTEGMSGVRIDKLPNQVNRYIENELSGYDLSENDVFVFSVSSGRSLIHGALRVIRGHTGFACEFYAIQIY